MRTSPWSLIRAGRTGDDESELANHADRVDAREGEKCPDPAIAGSNGETGERGSRWRGAASFFHAEGSVPSGMASVCHGAQWKREGRGRLTVGPTVSVLDNFHFSFSGF